MLQARACVQSCVDQGHADFNRHICGAGLSMLQRSPRRHHSCQCTCLHGEFPEELDLLSLLMPAFNTVSHSIIRSLSFSGVAITCSRPMHARMLNNASWRWLCGAGDLAIGPDGPHSLRLHACGMPPAGGQENHKSWRQVSEPMGLWRAPCKCIRSSL